MEKRTGSNGWADDTDWRKTSRGEDAWEEQSWKNNGWRPRKWRETNVYDDKLSGERGWVSDEWGNH